MVNDIISVNGISKSFGPISALCDVSLSVQQGLVTAIVGDNGSGKSTLIKLLSGNLAPDAGTITVEGREHTHLTIAQALQMGIRTVYQDLSLDDWKNSYENIFLGHERMHGPFLDRCRMEREAAEQYGWEEVCVVPRPHAGGSWATTCWKQCKDPIAVEEIRAHAGIDIGGTLIGMHLRRVAVPVRLSLNRIGEANILCARTRPKLIGGERAKYTEED